VRPEKLITCGHEVNNTVAATGSVLDSLTHYSTDRMADPDFNTTVPWHRSLNLGEFMNASPAWQDARGFPASIAQVLENAPVRGTCASGASPCGYGRLHGGHRRPLIEQALVNILKNAVEATLASMAAQSALPGQRGRIELAVVREAQAVRLSVADSGNRLGDAPPEQLFSPFFTTKKGGQGVGLLFVREVLQRHGFAYRLAATGQGQTCFDIWFKPPVATGGALAEP
jgi:signal transduction histidine kinase